MPLAEANADNWTQIYLGLGSGGVLQSTVSDCVLDSVDGSVMKFTLDQVNSTLYDPSHQARMAELLGKYFNEAVSVEIELGPVDRETPAATLIRLKAERQALAVATMQNDPVVQEMIQRFEAVLQEDSIAPID